MDMKRKVAVVLGWTLVIAFVAIAAESGPKYAPTETQTLRLKLAQRDAQLAQRELQMTCSDPQVKFQKAIANLNAEGDKVKSENSWPKDVAFNPDTLAFTDPPPPPPAPAKPIANGNADIAPAAPGVAAPEAK